MTFARGLEALDRNEWPAALACFEKAGRLQNIPIHNSYLALCLAKERGQFRQAFLLCAGAIEQEPENSVHYLNLGKVYLLQGDRNEAISTFRKGLALEANRHIITELAKLGIRRPPPLPFLPRENPLNKYLGIILARLGLR